MSTLDPSDSGSEAAPSLAAIGAQAGNADSIKLSTAIYNLVVGLLHMLVLPIIAARSRWCAVSAPEHADNEWQRLCADGIFSADCAKLIPKVDKLRNEDVWQTVQTLTAQGMIPNEHDDSYLDITDGTHLRWWLWVCHYRRVIGTGVRTAHVAIRTHFDGIEAVFHFMRTDYTVCAMYLTEINEELCVFMTPTEQIMEQRRCFAAS